MSSISAGTTSTTTLVHSGDTTGSLVFKTNDTGSGGTTAVTIDTSQRVGIGTTSPATKLQVTGGSIHVDRSASGGASQLLLTLGASSGGNFGQISNTGTYWALGYGSSQSTVGTQSVVWDSSGTLLVGKTVTTFSTAGIAINSGGAGYSTFTRSGGGLADFNRLSDDGELIAFYQDTTKEGNVSVSGTTVSYNGGHLARYAQTTTAKDESLVKGTVLSNLDAMNVYTDAEGNPIANEQLNKVKVSDVEGDANVAGVFVNWSYDEQHSVDEINMAMTGDMIIRIAHGVTVQRGDLLMSAGDGTAKTQGDDIVRSKTIAKVTSNHVTCTYADGSYCVPCVLMAC